MEPKLTLEKATKIAHSVESAVQNVHQLQSVQPVQESREGVHKVGSSPQHTREREVQQSQVRLCTHSGEPLEVMGSLRVRVRHGGQDINLPLTVVKGNGPRESLAGAPAN